MTRDSHLQSKNWFRQLFEVAHHLSNSWASYIRWHAFWLEYILSEDTEPDMIITSFAKVFDYKITSSFDWLVASRPHSFLKTPTNSHLTTERPNVFFWNIPRHHADDTIKWKAKQIPPPGFPQEPCSEPCSCQWRTCFGSTYISSSSTCCSSCS